MSRAGRLALLALALAGEPARAQLSSDPEAPAPPLAAAQWRAEKCARYARDWGEALSRMGRDGLSQTFLRDHDAFLGRGCEDPRAVCPRSKAELDLANVLVLRAMNAGMASTFLPFACKSGR